MLSFYRTAGELDNNIFINKKNVELQRVPGDEPDIKLTLHCTCTDLMTIGIATYVLHVVRHNPHTE